MVPFANQVQLLCVPQLIPCSRKVKGWSRDRFEVQDALIKFAALFHILYVQRHVIQFPMFHDANLVDYKVCFKAGEGVSIAIKAERPTL